MNEATAERLKRVFSTISPDPTSFVADFMKEQIRAGRIPAEAAGIDMARKARSIGSLLSLLVYNADLLDRVEPLMKSYTAVGVPSPFVEAFHGVARELLADHIAQRAREAGVSLDDQLIAAFVEVVEVLDLSVSGQGEQAA
ncbi:MAG: hypothetical protein AAGB51_10780 [Planctomycetota bacterium]